MKQELTPAVWDPHSEEGRAEVTQQLELLLADDLFKNSKRFPAFLRFVVEETLKGSTDKLKERTIGVFVFGRDPEYHTADDPIVRNTAVEVRKRMAQYYQSRVTPGPVLITVPVGSYVPTFQRFQDIQQAAPAETAPVIAKPAQRSRANVAWLAVPLVALGAAALLFPWGTAPLQDFWKPVFAAGTETTICVAPPVSTAHPGEAENPTLEDMHANLSESISIFDARAAARLETLLGMNHVTTEIRSDFATTMADLRRGPIILIGGFNNKWTKQLTGELRFVFERGPERIRSIKDRQNPSFADWTIDYATLGAGLKEDYALITRMFDPATGRPLVVVAGITRYGTAAASEFVTTEAYIKQLADRAPKGWDRKNVQVVISTTVINENSGPPRILATHFWDAP